MTHPRPSSPSPAPDPRWAEVDAYFAATVAPVDDALTAALADSAAAGLPAISVAPNQGKLLRLLALTQGARAILEIGTLGGYSTIWLARALPADGRLVTLESDPARADVARANLARAGLDRLVEIRTGAALDTLPLLETEGAGPFDLVFIDADKVNNPRYTEWALRLSRPGTLIIVDNVVRDGKILVPDPDDPAVTGTRELFELVAREPRLDATALQTVGAKGYDGLLIARVTD
ncbi:MULTISPECIES: O-methyltransferase [unclassified Streptomyces]|uniref:O-methyltransferase n=1 Tax=unclassified Streptomyces TaxID=2593676 RepID=UPI00166084D4|nr:MULTISPECIES: O-methyltransferase [unclassified Streptomyces]MBD0707959.1 methyltransferase [Streptomyces sp. CBMA291]MBD0715947.1 methyltransferase [Streptomyces sp. CBMA370]